MIDQLQEDLRLLDVALAALPDEENPAPLSSSWMTRRSLLEQRAGLKQRLAIELAATTTPVLRLLFDTPLGVERVDAGLLGAALSRLQETVTSVAHAVTGYPNARSTRPAIAEKTRLTFAGAAFSSFGVVLEGTFEPTQQALIEDVGPAFGLLEESVVRIFDVLETGSVSSADEDELMDSVADLGRRAVKHLRDLSVVLGRQSEPIKFEWNGADVRHRRVTLSAGELTTLQQFLSGVDTLVEQLTVPGVLVGARTDRGKFFFRSDKGRTYAGAMTDELRPLVREFFDRPCQARLEVTIARSRVSGREGRSYFLLELLPPN